MPYNKRLEEYNKVEIVRRMKKRRKELGITQEKLCERLELTDGQISKYENSDGETNFPKFNRCLDICNELECERGFLLGEK